MNTPIYRDHVVWEIVNRVALAVTKQQLQKIDVNHLPLSPRSLDNLVPALSTLQELLTSMV